jgi:hypothetical protein
MKTWDLWAPDILPSVVGCSTPLMMQELRHAARDLFRRTKSWQEWTDPVVGDGVRTNFTIPLPNDGELWKIENAVADTVPIDVVNWRSMPAPPEDWNPGAGIYSTDRLTFNLVGYVTPGVPITLKVTLIPSLNSRGLSDDMAALTWETLAHGAKARIMQIPKFDFSNAQQAMLEKAEYEEGVGRLQLSSFTNNSSAVPRAWPKWL